MSNINTTSSIDVPFSATTVIVVPLGSFPMALIRDFRAFSRLASAVFLASSSANAAYTLSTVRLFGRMSGSARPGT